MFRSDGVGTFDATVWTDHTTSGDIWHSAFVVTDDDNIGLFNLGEFNSPTTNGAHVPMHAQFTYQANYFARLPRKLGITQNSAC